MDGGSVTVNTLSSSDLFFFRLNNRFTPKDFFFFLVVAVVTTVSFSPTAIALFRDGDESTN
jgi:hypothetical protein